MQRRLAYRPWRGSAPLASLALILTACAGGGGASSMDERFGRPAQVALNPAGLLIASCDTNGDYSVSPAELAAGISHGWTAADRDGDGTLSVIELSDWRTAAFGSAGALPGRYAFDANQDSTVSQAEFAAAIRTVAAGYADAGGAIPFAALARQMEDYGPDGRELDFDRMIQPRTGGQTQ